MEAFELYLIGSVVCLVAILWLIETDRH